ncbi:MAG: hypothetical protein WDM84_02420 [Bauldia sp.]
MGRPEIAASLGGFQERGKRLQHGVAHPGALGRQPGGKIRLFESHSFQEIAPVGIEEIAAVRPVQSLE